MQIVRTIVWVVLLFAVLVFSWGNWDQNVAVRIWAGLVWDTKLPAVVIVSFLLGFLPMWLIHRSSKWSMKRRITSLETATARLATPPPATTLAEPVRPTHPPMATRPANLPPEPANPVDPEPTKPQ